MNRFYEFLSVGTGGLIGTVLRYGISLVPLPQPGGFPVTTLTVNAVGAFLIGVIAALAGKNGADPRVLLFLRVGLCGGFTTFSSFALETHSLLASGRLFTGASYAALSVLLCVAAVAVATVAFD